MNARLFKRPLVMALALGAAGCADSALGNSGDPLAPEEVTELVQALTEISFVGVEVQEGPGPFQGTVDETRTCAVLPESGFFSALGAYEGRRFQNGDFEVTGEVVLDFLGCEFQFDDYAIDFYGDPGVSVQYELVNVSGVDTYFLDLDGGLSFEASDGRSGRCAAKLRVEIVFGPGPTEYVVSGSMCRIADSEITL